MADSLGKTGSELFWFCCCLFLVFCDFQQLPNFSQDKFVSLVFYWSKLHHTGSLLSLLLSMDPGNLLFLSLSVPEASLADDCARWLIRILLQQLPRWGILCETFVIQTAWRPETVTRETQNVLSVKAGESIILSWTFLAIQGSISQTNEIGAVWAAGGGSCSCAGALQQPGGGEELIQISLLINFLCISL